MTHAPVLLQEVIKALALKEGETFVDLTLNRGGHSRALCEALGKSGKLIGVDADQNALKIAQENLRTCPGIVTLVESNFKELDKVLAEQGIEQVDAILADLGLSSEQLAGSGRGFSFQTDEPLLMTLAAHPAPDALTAAHIVNTWQEETLADIIYAYGEERFARRIAKQIVESRDVAPIETTLQLVDVIAAAVPVWYRKGRLHFATKTFQALRITVNDELGSLKTMLTSAYNHLVPGGRLAIITFHSLEARIVKKYFPHSLVVRPTRAEVLENPRARSAQLRIINKEIA
jgi:16S rRNA (cytosine1402-N4)-methyltransferase